MHLNAWETSRTLIRSRQQLEAELLEELRQAEAEFIAAGPDRKERAAENFRIALRRFSELVLDRRVPPGLSAQI